MEAKLCVLLLLLPISLAAGPPATLNDTSATQLVSPLPGTTITVYGSHFENTLNPSVTGIYASASGGLTCNANTQSVTLSNLDKAGNTFLLQNVDLTGCMGPLTVMFKGDAIVGTIVATAVADVATVNITAPRPLVSHGNQTLIVRGSFPSNDAADYAFTLSGGGGCSSALASQAVGSSNDLRVEIVSNVQVNLHGIDLLGCDAAVSLGLNFRTQGAQPAVVIGGFGMAVFSSSDTQFVSPTPGRVLTIYGTNFLSTDRTEYLVLTPNAKCDNRILPFLVTQVHPTYLVVQSSLNGCDNPLNLTVYYPQSFLPVQFPTVPVAGVVRLTNTTLVENVVSAYRSQLLVRGESFAGSSTPSDYALSISSTGRQCWFGSVYHATPTAVDAVAGTLLVEGIDLSGCVGVLFASLNWKAQGAQPAQYLAVLVLFTVADTQQLSVISPLPPAVAQPFTLISPNMTFTSENMNDYAVYLSAPSCPAGQPALGQAVTPASVTSAELLTLPGLDWSACATGVVTAVVGFRDYGNSSAVSVATILNACANSNGGCDEHAACSVLEQGTNGCACDDGFSGDGYTCTAASCGSLPSVTNSVANTCSPPLHTGDSCQLGCAVGYHVKAGTSASLQCVPISGTVNSQFNTTLACQQSQCVLPSLGPHQDSFLCTNQTLGDSCTLGCLAGYDKSAGSSFTAPCVDAGNGQVQYSINLNCVASTCPAPVSATLAASHISPGSCVSSLTTDSSCQLACRSGYSHGVTSTTATCSGIAGTPTSHLIYSIVCSDVNECGASNGGCDAYANCFNTAGTHYCVCAPGYTGDGLTCSVSPPTLDAVEFFLRMVVPDHYVNPGSQIDQLNAMLPYLLWVSFFNSGVGDNGGVLSPQYIYVLGTTVLQSGQPGYNCAGGADSYSLISVGLAITGTSPSYAWLQQRLMQLANNCSLAEQLTPYLQGNETFGFDTTINPPSPVSLVLCSDGVYRSMCNESSSTGGQPVTSSSGVNKLAIILGVIFGVLALLLLILLCWWCRKRQKQYPKKERVPSVDAGDAVPMEKMCRQCNKHPAAADQLCMNCQAERTPLATETSV